MESIITSLITGLCVAIPSVIATISANTKSQTAIELKIKQLDEKVHEHNNLIDRMYKVENRVTLLEEKHK